MPQHTASHAAARFSPARGTALTAPRPAPRPAPRIGRSLVKFIREMDEKFGRGADALEPRWTEIVRISGATAD